MDACLKGGSAMRGGGFSHDIIMSAYGEPLESATRTLISVGSQNWMGEVALHDGTEHGGFSMFTATAAKVPRDFLNNVIWGPTNGRLTDEYCPHIDQETRPEINALELQAALEAEKSLYREEGLESEQIEALTRVVSVVLNAQRQKEVSRIIAGLNPELIPRLDSLRTKITQAGIQSWWMNIHLGTGLPELNGRRPIDLVINPDKDTEEQMLRYLTVLDSQIELKVEK